MPKTDGFFPAEIIVEAETAAISTEKVRLATINARVTVGIIKYKEGN